MAKLNECPLCQKVPAGEAKRYSYCFTYTYTCQCGMCIGTGAELDDCLSVDDIKKKAKRMWNTHVKKLHKRILEIAERELK